MKKTDAIKFYGNSTKIAKVLNCSKCAIVKWGELVPLHAAAKLEYLSGGQLKLNPEDYFTPWGDLTSKTCKY